jgi:hypothetical protein
VKRDGNCVLPGCHCQTDGLETYCSEYCRQAASHAPERDYCQCGHSTCALPSSSDASADVNLTEAIRFDPGRVTIQCSSLEQLSEQLRLLSAALVQHSEELRIKVEGTPARRPAAIETNSRSTSARHG